MKTRAAILLLSALMLLPDIKVLAGQEGEPGEGVLFITNRPVALRFERFTIGPRTYSNLVVTARTDTDVFIRHQNGIGNFKVDELTEEQREQLGYKAEAKPSKAASNPIAAATLATQTIVDQFKTPETREKLAAFAQKVRARVRGEKPPAEGADAGETAEAQAPASLRELIALAPRPFLIAAAALLISFPIANLLFAITARMICRKAGSEPSFLIWVPFLSIIPLLRAAKLSGWCFLLFLIPAVNFFAGIWLMIMISKARGKGVLTAASFLFPPAWPFSWLYLAFSK